MKCWGRNTYGELGDGTVTDRHSPVSVVGVSGATALAAGAYFTCALLSGGTVDCWGYNGHGQLGINSVTDRHSPVPVPGLTGVTAISAFAGHACSLSGGQVKCWGYNANGQLGDNTTTDRRVPTLVAGLSGVAQISVGGAHTCALLTAATVKCWGYNKYGQVGDNTTTDRHKPAATPIAGLTGVIAISAGGNHTCALTVAHAVRCWGDNLTGQLGDGTTTDRHKPAATPIAGLTGVVAISAGGSHTCAVLAAGTVECWGYNLRGEIGDNPTANRLAPTTVPGL